MARATSAGPLARWTARHVQFVQVPISITELRAVAPLHHRGIVTAEAERMVPLVVGSNWHAPAHSVQQSLRVRRVHRVTVPALGLVLDAVSETATLEDRDGFNRSAVFCNLWRAVTLQAKVTLGDPEHPGIVRTVNGVALDAPHTIEGSMMCRAAVLGGIRLVHVALAAEFALRSDQQRGIGRGVRRMAGLAAVFEGRVPILRLHRGIDDRGMAGAAGVLTRTHARPPRATGGVDIMARFARASGEGRMADSSRLDSMTLIAGPRDIPIRKQSLAGRCVWGVAGHAITSGGCHVASTMRIILMTLGAKVCSRTEQWVPVLPGIWSVASFAAVLGACGGGSSGRLRLHMAACSRAPLGECDHRRGPRGRAGIRRRLQRRRLQSGGLCEDQTPQQASHATNHPSRSGQPPPAPSGEGERALDGGGSVPHVSSDSGVVVETLGFTPIARINHLEKPSEDDQAEKEEAKPHGDDGHKDDERASAGIGGFDAQ